MVRRALARLRRAAPGITLVSAIALAGVSLWQAWGTIGHLREEAVTTSIIYGTVIGALSDTLGEARTETLLTLSRNIGASGIPLIVTDLSGTVSACTNLPFEPDPCALGPDQNLEDPRIRTFANRLDADNVPVEAPGGWRIHFGATDTARQLTLLTVFQLAVLGVAVATATWAYRAVAHLHRDRLWVAMARESAHQLGTPLMSAAAWIERLRDREPDTKQIARFLQADLDRLERVAQRFERIGRPARREKVGMGSLAERVVAYFRPRLPKHANQVSIQVDAPSAGPMVSGDPVLLEWALEALVRNSIDALSGRGGHIRVAVRRRGETVLVHVEDDGPGIGIEVRGNLFEPGITTKSGGWGIGLALAHRIVEDIHGGTLRFEAVEQGASFVAELPVAAP
jgi:signal transduction histidine kinase